MANGSVDSPGPDSPVHRKFILFLLARGGRVVESASQGNVYALTHHWVVVS